MRHTTARGAEATYLVLVQTEVPHRATLHHREEADPEFFLQLDEHVLIALDGLRACTHVYLHLWRQLGQRSGRLFKAAVRCRQPSQRRRKQTAITFQGNFC